MGDGEIRFDPVVLSGNETLLPMAAREGMGFAFLPRVIVEDDLAAGTLEHLLPTALTPSAPSTPSTPTAPTCLPRCGRFWIFWCRRDGEGAGGDPTRPLPAIAYLSSAPLGRAKKQCEAYTDIKIAARAPNGYPDWIEMNSSPNHTTLEYFSIEGLHGRQDVAFTMAGRTGIFISDNGSGKTTALFILQSILKKQFSRLSKFKYERICIKFSGHEAFSISSNDYLELRRHSYFLKYFKNAKISPDAVLNLANHARNIPLSRLREDSRFMEVSDLLRVPPSILMQRLKNLRVTLESEPDYALEARRLIADGDRPITMLSIFLDTHFSHSVLYLPTYRRVEQDLEELMQIDDEEMEFNPLDIHFGMKDVEERQNSTTHQIRDHFLSSYGQISGQMLGQLTDNTPISNDMKILLNDRSSIELVLRRVRDYVSDRHTSAILKQFDDGTLLDNQYLSFFLSSLIEAYQQVKEVDTSLQRYAQVCNGYLINKEMRYDSLNATVAIYETLGGSKLDLATLSSGEKQILGVMSELYLGANPSYVVIYDEPELSLSMDWQKKILVDVAASEKTFTLIAATHSPFVFDNELDVFARSLDIQFHAPTEK